MAHLVFLLRDDMHASFFWRLRMRARAVLVFEKHEGP